MSKALLLDSERNKIYKTINKLLVQGITFLTLRKGFGHCVLMLVECDCVRLVYNLRQWRLYFLRTCSKGFSLASFCVYVASS